MDRFVRPATDDDALDVRRILDAAMLEPGDVETRIAEENVLVAGDARGSATSDGDPANANGSNPTTDGESSTDGEPSTGGERILGAIVLESRDEEGAHVSAIGVRRRHRADGIGRALIERALEREGRLTARFDDGVRPFNERLGFSIEPIDGQRHRGVKVDRRAASD